MLRRVVIAGMGAGLDRVLLGGQAEGVPAHRVQHVEAAHALVAREDVGGGVALRDGRRAARRRTGRGTCRARSTSGFAGSISARKVCVLAPERLPARLDALGVVGHGRRSVPARRPGASRQRRRRGVPDRFRLRAVGGRTGRRRMRSSGVAKPSAEPRRLVVRRLGRHRRDGGRRGARRDAPVPHAAGGCASSATSRSAAQARRVIEAAARAGALVVFTLVDREAAQVLRDREASARRGPRGPARSADLERRAAPAGRAAAPSPACCTASRTTTSAGSRPSSSPCATTTARTCTPSTRPTSS